MSCPGRHGTPQGDTAATPAGAVEDPGLVRPRPPVDLHEPLHLYRDRIRKCRCARSSRTTGGKETGRQERVVEPQPGVPISQSQLRGIRYSVALRPLREVVAQAKQPLLDVRQ